MKKHQLFNTSTTNLTQICVDQPADEFSFEHWQTRHVLNWLRGIDESVSPYLRLFAQLNGAALNKITDERLRRIGVNKDAVRRLILQGCNLLIYYSYNKVAYDIVDENAQKLAMKVVVSVQNLMNAINLATPVINNPAQSSRSLVVLNTVLLSVAEIHEDVTKLIFWLDRYPFDEKKEFIKIRDKIAGLIQEIVDCINDPNNPKFFSVPQLLVEKGKAIQEISRSIIQYPDPYVLSTAYIQRVPLYAQCVGEWVLLSGIEFRSTCAGIHLITNVPSDVAHSGARYVHVGDELIEVGRQTVIGWKHGNVLRKMESMAKHGPHGYELEITLCKRPRECWINFTFQKPRAYSPTTDKTREDQKKMVLDFKRKIQPDLFTRHTSENVAMRRGRSASLSDKQELRKQRSMEESVEKNEQKQQNKSPSLMMIGDKRPLFRRASVWSESPPAVLRSPFDRLHYAAESNAWLLLLASWGESNRTRHNVAFAIRNTPRMLLPKNGIPIEEEDEDVLSSTEYEDLVVDDGSLCVISDGDIESLNIKAANAEDAEWTAPIREDITGCKVIKRVHLESGSSLSNVDSPLSNIQAKITRFLYGSEASTDQQNSMSTSFSDKADGGTPLTPLSKVFQDLVFSTPKIQQQFSPVTAESPNSFSRSASPQSVHSQTLSKVNMSKVMNIVNRRSRLAPLAEPDEASDSDEVHKIESKQSISTCDLFRSNSMEQLAHTPANELEDNVHEGWIRRQKVANDHLRSKTKRDSQWIKCWFVLTSSHVSTYANQESKYADIVIKLRNCEIDSQTQLRTSKKNTFTIGWKNGSLSFAAYTYVDAISWIKMIAERINTLATSNTTEENQSDSNILFTTASDDSDSSSSTATTNTLSSKVSLLKPARFLSRISRRSSRTQYSTTPNRVSTASPISQN
ncbi:hypothetical protein M3Y96_00848400 [Aphelenchoides besseyi]|nr:hypothetical protein M3Y96_00848400 [Aphelenchoides besseyi]